jgi:hypothetical protein
MPVRSPKWPFTPAAIENSPDDWGGVYVLWQGDTVLYIGAAPDGAPSIKDDLLAHWRGERGPCTQQATHYGWELSQNPRQRALELLKEYVERHRSYPRCNERH